MKNFNNFCHITHTYESDITIENRENKKTADDIMQDSITASEKFLDLGVKPSGTIAICMPNCYEAIVCFLAANRIGAAVAFLDDSLPADEVRHCLKDFRSPLLINYGKSAEENRELISETGTKYVLTLNPKKDASAEEKGVFYGDLFAPPSTGSFLKNS